MSFSMRVNTARHYKDWYFVGVSVDEGDFRWGDVAFVLGCPERSVKIMSSSIIDTVEPRICGATTLTVGKPSFPIEELVGTVLVDREPAYGSGRPSLISHSKERS